MFLRNKGPEVTLVPDPRLEDLPSRTDWYKEDTRASVRPGLTRPTPQAYKDISSDRRTGLSSFFAFGKRANERGSYEQAHMTPSGVPGILNLKVCDVNGGGIAFAPFNWNGRQMVTDAYGMIKYIDKDYFQTAISLENERVKYVTQMISLVAGQPADNVIALFGYDFYTALAGSESTDDNQAVYAQKLYRSYLSTAGVPDDVAVRKMYVFKRYSNAEASPEVMCNFGDNDPEWSRAFNKLALLVEYHPSAMLFDSGSLNPLESSGRVHGDSGMSNPGGLDPKHDENVKLVDNLPMVFKDSNAGIRASKDNIPALLSQKRAFQQEAAKAAQGAVKME